MKYILIVIISLTVSVFGQTRAIVPRADGEGSVGDGGRAWGTGYFDRVYINGSLSPVLPFGVTGIQQVATWNGTNWVAESIGAVTPTPFVGTNSVKFSDATGYGAWPVTNKWMAPSTQILFTVWGATGGGGSSGGGHTRAIWRGPVGTIFDIVIGRGGLNSAGQGSTPGPFSGQGLAYYSSALQSNRLQGGGATFIAIANTTNYILMAGGSGGGSPTHWGGPGGFSRGWTDGAAGSNVFAGRGAYADNEYGVGATAGTNITVALDSSADGSFLQGGNWSTNGCTAGVFTGDLGGGGGGWFGGAGGTRTNATTGTVASAGGGGGLCYANTNYVSFAQILNGLRGVAANPQATDHPTYTSGRGVGANTTFGNTGCAGAMW